MISHNVLIGVLLVAFTVGVLTAKYLTARQKRSVPRRGWAGVAIILFAELILFLHHVGWPGGSNSNWLATFFTPVVWTGYILLVDGMVLTLQGSSILERSSKGFFSLAFWSVPLWLIFEAYNLRLKNWAYVGLPDDPVLRDFGFAWSFATIWPAIFETAEFIRAVGFFGRTSKRQVPLTWLTRLSMSFCGLALLTLPVLVPARFGRYLFGAVWLGFALLLDPLNYRWKGRSFLGDFEEGETSTFWSFLSAGWVCGILWEFWNYWAVAKWLYIFPIGQGSKIFEMPFLGYLGFPFFALECRAMYEFLRNFKRRLFGLRQNPGWEAAGSKS